MGSPTGQSDGCIYYLYNSNIKYQSIYSDIPLIHAAMNDTFSVNISSTSNVSVAIGSNISLLCEATMDASISWFFNGLPVKVSISIAGMT